MKDRNIFERLGDFVLGKGFYIVLFLCVATIGISGYFFVRTMRQPAEPSEPAGTDTPITLPDPVGMLPYSTNNTTVPDLEETDTQVSNQSGVTVTLPDPPETSTDTESVQNTEPERPVAVVYTWPVKGEVLRDFSLEVLSPDPTLGDWRTHSGMDIAAAQGEKVLALRAGTVSMVYDDGLMGTTVVIDHGDGLTSTYCNLASSPSVQKGDTVDTGTILGTVGESALAESGMASHLHLETRMDGDIVDPSEYLPEI